MQFEVILRDQFAGNFISKVTGVPGATVSLAMAQAPGHVIELLEYSGPDDRKIYRPRNCDVGSVHIAFFVEDIEAILARVEAAGWTAYDQPQHIDRGPPEGTLVMYVRGPDGVSLEFMQLLGELPL